MSNILSYCSKEGVVESQIRHRFIDKNRLLPRGEIILEQAKIPHGAFCLTKIAQFETGRARSASILLKFDVILMEDIKKSKWSALSRMAKSVENQRAKEK